MQVCWQKRCVRIATILRVKKARGDALVCSLIRKVFSSMKPLVALHFEGSEMMLRKKDGVCLYTFWTQSYVASGADLRKNWGSWVDSRAMDCVRSPRSWRSLQPVVSVACIFFHPLGVHIPRCFLPAWGCISVYRQFSPFLQFTQRRQFLMHDHLTQVWFSRWADTILGKSSSLS